MELTDEQKTAAGDMIAVLTKALEVTVVPAPAFNYVGLTVTVYDAFVEAGERTVLVPVALSAPAEQTMVIRYLSQNGTAVENFQYSRADGYLSFQPGEQVKSVPVKLLQDLGTKKFTLILGWAQNSPPLTLSRSTATISGDRSNLTVTYPGAALPKVSALSPRPANLSLAFVEKFTSFAASDSGFKADGTPCWRTRLNQGRTQAGNREVGYYADSTVNPNTTPYSIVSGKLVLNSAYHPEGVLDVNGAQIPCPWDVVNNVIQPFKYSASIVTTEKNFGTIRRGSYVEAKMTMPLAQGSWPAFWMVATDQSWPSIELDMFEGFFSTAGTLDQVGTTVHWKDAATGNHTLFSSRLKQLGIDVAVAHVWGVYWGDDEVVFYCDDVPYFAVPNVFPDKDCYLQINIAVGGLVTKPAVPTSYSAQMPIEWVKVWQ